MAAITSSALIVLLMTRSAASLDHTFSSLATLHLRELSSNVSPTAGYSRMALSTDGTRLVVAEARDETREYPAHLTVDNNAVSNATLSIYHLEEHDSDDSDFSWNLTDSIPLADASDIVIAMDGDSLAVRQEDNVQLYRISPFKHSLGISVPVHDCREASFLDLTSQFLTVGCPSFDQNRGRLDVFMLGTDSWLQIIAKEGASHGERFGARAVVDDEAPALFTLFRLAVSAPGFDNSRGYVQTWDLDVRFVNPSHSMLNEALIPFSVLEGSSPGNLFGETLALCSGLDETLLAVGAPGSIDSIGQVSVFEASGDLNWAAIGVKWGLMTGESFGTALDITKTRLVVSNSRGRMVVYNLKRRPHLELEYKRGLDFYASEMASPSQVSANDAGSLLVVIANGAVFSFVDESPFCREVKLGTKVNASFLHRDLCYADGQVVEIEEDCENLAFQEGNHCEWISWKNDDQFLPSIPSSAPSNSPSAIVATTTNTPSGEILDLSVTPSAVPTSSSSYLESSMPTGSMESIEDESFSPSTAPTQISPLSVLPSTVPSVSVLVSNRPSGVMNEIHAFQCTELREEQPDHLSAGSPLIVCLDHTHATLTLQYMALEQEPSRLVVWDSSKTIDLLEAQGITETETTVSCMASGCQVHIMALPSFFFELGRPDEITVTGSVGLVQQSASTRSSGPVRSRVLRSPDQTASFELKIPVVLVEGPVLEEDDSPVGVPTAKKENQKTWPIVLFWLAVAVIIVLLCLCQFRAFFPYPVSWRAGDS